MRQLERVVLLQIIDERWREHLYDMDYLREGIHLRGFAQKDPLVEYKNEGFTLFRDLMNSIWEDFGRYIFHVEVEIEPAAAEMTMSRLVAQRRRSQRQLLRRRPGAALGALRRRRAGRRRAGEPPRATDEYAALPEVETRHVDEREQIGRNDPCWCGSGKKYKKCHGAVDGRASGTEQVPARVSKLRDQLKLLADYL